MYKFRSEAWGKKVGRNKDWTTCYSDVINGYGHFLGTNALHSRKQSNHDGVKDRMPPKASEAMTPKLDHIWDVLERKGMGNGGNARSRLRHLMREQHKRRANLRQEKAKLDDWELKYKPKYAKYDKKLPVSLPPLETIKVTIKYIIYIMSWFWYVPMYDTENHRCGLI